MQQRYRKNRKDTSSMVSTKGYTLLFMILVALAFFVIHADEARVSSRLWSSSETSSCDYGIAMDAGSSGTRIHVYKRTKNHELLSDVFVKKVTPGISSFANDPKKVKDSILLLTKYGETAIPSKCRSITPIHLMATAGMRLVPKSTSDSIFKYVRSALQESSFQFQDDWAGVISGQTEALYDWISVNLASGALPLDSSSSLDSLVGAADLGGASAQVAYPVSSLNRNDPGVVLLSLPTKDGHRVKVPIYAVSRLRYGMYEAHRQILSSWTEPIFPCDIHGGESLDSNKIGTGRFNECVDLIGTFFVRSERKGLGDLLPQEAKRPPPRRSDMKLYAIDNFGKMASILEAFDRYRQGDKNTRIKPESTIWNPSWIRYEDLGEALCASNWNPTVSNLVNYWGSGNEKKLRHSCFGSAYMMTMIRELYKFDSSIQIALANEINGVDASWAMGSMYAILEKLM